MINGKFTFALKNGQSQQIALNGGENYITVETNNIVATDTPFKIEAGEQDLSFEISPKPTFNAFKVEIKQK